MMGLSVSRVFDSVETERVKNVENKNLSKLRKNFGKDEHIIA